MLAYSYPTYMYGSRHPPAPEVPTLRLTYLYQTRRHAQGCTRNCRQPVSPRNLELGTIAIRLHRPGTRHSPLTESRTPVRIQHSPFSSAPSLLSPQRSRTRESGINRKHVLRVRLLLVQISGTRRTDSTGALVSYPQGSQERRRSGDESPRGAAPRHFYRSNSSALWARMLPKS